MTEAAGAPVAFVELLHDPEFDLFHRYEHHLRDAFARLNLVTVRASIPARYKDLSLVVGIDKPGQVAQHESMLVSQA